MAQNPAWKVINEIKLDDIIDYCEKHKEVEWLKSVALQEGLTNKNGKPRKTSFIEVRNEFCRKFFPDLAPKPRKKQISMYDRIANL